MGELLFAAKRDTTRRQLLSLSLAVERPTDVNIIYTQMLAGALCQWLWRALDEQLEMEQFLLLS